jgi:hypothetical protein
MAKSIGNAKCNARATISNGKLIKSSGGHMHSTDFNIVLKSQLKSIIIARLADSPFVSANELYDGAVRTLCDAYAFGSDTMSQIVSFDGIKTSIYRCKIDYMPLLFWNQPILIYRMVGASS